MILGLVFRHAHVQWHFDGRTNVVASHHRLHNESIPQLTGSGFCLQSRVNTGNRHTVHQQRQIFGKECPINIIQFVVAMLLAWKNLLWCFIMMRRKSGIVCACDVHIVGFVVDERRCFALAK